MSTSLRATDRGPRTPGEVTAGRLGRRRALPSGRAVTGGFLVAVAAVVVFSAWLSTQASSGHSWVVARHDLAIGTRLTPADVVTATMRLPRVTAGAYGDERPLFGRILAAPLRGGDLIQSSSLVPVGSQPALRPVTVTVAGADLSSLVPGDLTVVFVTTGSDATATTVPVVRGATVLSIARSGSGLIGSQGGDQATLGVGDLAEVQAIVHAQHTGTLSLVVGEPSDGLGLGPQPGALPTSRAAPTGATAAGVEPTTGRATVP
ncbi:MAG: SAF domain-containing protein [Actinomycetota bacterium]|nr:SAF domain-containing protein [Actinomycetota bacterium]